MPQDNSPRNSDDISDRSDPVPRDERDPDDRPPVDQRRRRRFGGLGDKPATTTAREWRIKLSGRLNLRNDGELAQWTVWRRQILERAGDLLEARSLHPYLRWTDQEVSEREACYRMLITLEDDFDKRFEANSFVKLQSLRTLTLEAALLGQLAIAYMSSSESTAAEETVDRMRTAVSKATALGKALSKPAALAWLWRLFPWGDHRPTTREIEDAVSKLKIAGGLLRILERPAQRIADKIAASEQLNKIEDGVAGIAAGLAGEPSALFRVHSEQLGFLYGAEAELASEESVSSQAVSYLKTLEAWTAFALASVCQQTGESELAVYFAAEASSALEVALAQSETGVRATEVARGLELPGWRPLRSVQLNLQPKLADLRVDLDANQRK